MDDAQLFDAVRQMRTDGAAPKQIARALGVRPAVVAPMIRRLAAEAELGAETEAELVGCWVSPSWSRELLVDRRDGWDDVDLGPDGPAGIALALVARVARHDRVIVCGYLVDTFCLGIKNVIGPIEMRERDLPVYRRTYFMAFPSPALPVPIELARHLVHGAAAFASGLGFEPHPDFEGARACLGELDEPCAITFGREGRPLYVSGPHDDPIAVMETLMSSLGADGFAVAA